MAQQIKVQDGIVVYSTSDPIATDIDFTVRGLLNITKEVNIGDNPLAPGLIKTPPGSGVDLIIRTDNDGFTFGNIKLEPTPSGSIILNNVAWPDGTVTPVPGMYLGVSAPNTLQFYTLGQSAPQYDHTEALALQTVFNTTVPTVANGSGVSYLQVFVNGIKQIEGASKAYLVTGANQITFNAGLNLNDDVEFYAYS